ncbi:hypothetical protein GCM10009425_33440 [Pseudomonas asuensis]|uniref:Uncharacterized protein n=1 Tax=Pseudomonas asuensis TaxID=1825787 RepID=A0ABQ2GYD1_9PSED|nr:hypothetical protein GCM10009425_33440 [Pseudomonas asuensis]
MTEQDLGSGDELQALIQTGQARMVSIARRKSFHLLASAPLWKESPFDKHTLLFIR